MMDDCHVWHMESKLFSQLAPNKDFNKVDLGEGSKLGEGCSQLLFFLATLQTWKVIIWKLFCGELLQSKPVNIGNVWITWIEI